MSQTPTPRDDTAAAAAEAAECFLPTLDGLITSVVRGDEPVPVVRDRAAQRCASIAQHQAARNKRLAERDELSTPLRSEAAGAPVDDTAGRDPVVAAANLLFGLRHQLPPDVMRTLADVWTCASAARYGEPHERFWTPDEELGDPFADHDTAECEA